MNGVPLEDPVTTDFEACEPDPTSQCVDPTHWDNSCTPTIVENNACGEGLICANGPVPCVLPGNATGEFWLAPALVPTGERTNINWEVVDTTSCHVFDDNNNHWWGGAEGFSIPSEPIEETTRFELECANVFGEATSTIDVIYAVVVPTWVER